MLLYDFRCDDCGRVFEELVESRDDQVRCPACASTAAKRQLSAFSIGRSDGASRSAGDIDMGGGFGGGCSSGMCGM